MRIKDIAIIGMMSAVLVVALAALSFIPNIELVSLLIILFTLIFGWKTVYIIYVFVLVDGLLYGFGLNFFFYLYVWLILFLTAKIFNKVRSPFYWALISGAFGLLFGVFYSFLLITMISGVQAGFASWINGIPFDLAHCAGNFTAALFLFRPLYYILGKINRQIIHWD